MSRIIDTHCHLNFQAFQKDWKEVVERTLKSGTDMILVGTDLVTSQKAVEMAKQYSGVHAAVGFHPIHVLDRDWRSEILRIAELIGEKEVVVIGEIGFDRYRMPEEDMGSVIKTQETVFSFFLSEAKKHKKPLILHNREAWDLLENHISTIRTLGVRGVQHCFPEGQKEAEKLFEIGFKIGFNGLVTYNSKWDELIKNTTLDSILIETDAPYLTPVPFRGQRNEPAYVQYVAKHIAKLKGVSEEEVIAATSQNAMKVFGITV